MSKQAAQTPANTIAIIETPKGAGVKCDFDPQLGCYKLNKVMPAGLVFPFDFGFIPGTTGGDGDPLDIIVLSEFSTFPGCALEARIIGAIKAEQKERDGEQMRNDRIIAVAGVSMQYASVNTLSELPKGTLDELENFFCNYNQQAGKTFLPLKRLGATAAARLVGQAANAALKDTLVQLFVPLTDQHGQAFPEHYFGELSAELKERFGGVTIYSRSPAKGIWKTENEQTSQDELLIYEVLINKKETDFWLKLKTKLEKQLKQQEILILLSNTRKLGV